MLYETTTTNALLGWCIEHGRHCSLANKDGNCTITGCIHPDSYEYVQPVIQPNTPYYPPCCPRRNPCCGCPNYGKGPCWCILGSPVIYC